MPNTLATAGSSHTQCSPAANLPPALDPDLSAQLVARARASQHFLNEDDLSAPAGRDAGFQARRQEMFAACHWLSTMVPQGHGHDALKQGIDQISRHSVQIPAGPPGTRQQLLLGAGKHMVHDLCMLLDEDHRPSTRQAVFTQLAQGLSRPHLHPETDVLCALGQSLIRAVDEVSGTLHAQERIATSRQALSRWVSQSPEWSAHVRSHGQDEVVESLLEQFGLARLQDVEVDSRFDVGGLPPSMLNRAYGLCCRAWGSAY